MHTKKLSIGFAILLGTQIAVAEEESGWKGEGELGFTQTSGNTETQSLVAKLALSYKLTSWKHEAKLEALRSENDSVLSAERYELNLQSDYFLSDKSSIFGKLRYEEDSFSSYDYQASLIVGYGHQIIDTERTGLNLEAGIGMRRGELEIVANSNDETVGYLGLIFRQKIGSHSEFTQYFQIEGGSDNVYTESDTGFKVNII
jgi:putative salt-induced outer membrane protein